MASNPSDWWGAAPKAIEKPTGGRVVRLLTDDAEGEGIMPTGVYDRTKKKADAPPATDATPAPKKRGRKPRTLAVVAKVAKPNGDGSAGRFDVSVDLRGGAVTINANAGSLTLAPDEVLALFAFLGRR